MLAGPADRINALAQINSASSYLEVGVEEGATFFAVDIQDKVAVDPTFRFDLHTHSGPHAHFYQMTSDQFFRDPARAGRTFDFIYLDGLHTYEQTLRDFCASLECSTERTIWLLDDTIPSSWLAAQPKYLLNYPRLADYARRSPWMGDVFKIVLTIHDFFPQFSYVTFSGHGQTVLWREHRPDFRPTWNSLTKISKLSYRDSVRLRKSHMNIAEPAEVIERVRAGKDWRRSGGCG